MDLEAILVNFSNIINSDDYVLKSRFGFDQENADKFNFAIITKTLNGLEYQEMWILSNAYYDYETKHFVKIDPMNTSFGVQIQAKGSYPGEAELGYTDNIGINFWRNPNHAKDQSGNYINTFLDRTAFDYTDWEENYHIGALQLTGDNAGEWTEFGISAGWSNNFMTDSYGGITVGGAGLEIDGNGVFPYVRLTSSAFQRPKLDSNGQQQIDDSGNVIMEDMYLFGLLDNAYHPTLWGWDCDNNSTYSWFAGFLYPERSHFSKENNEATFVVMYNDTPYDENNIHNLDVNRWNTIFEISLNNVKMPTGLTSSSIKNAKALTNINSNQNETQANINDAIDTTIAELNNKITTLETYMSDIIKEYAIDNTTVEIINLKVGEYGIVKYKTSTRVETSNWGTPHVWLETSKPVIIENNETPYTSQQLDIKTVLPVSANGQIELSNIKCDTIGVIKGTIKVYDRSPTSNGTLLFSQEIRINVTP